MEKTTKTLKNVVTIILIVFAIWVGITAITGIKSVRAYLAETFGVGATNIDAFDGATTNYNGGLTRTEIKKQKSLDSCPTHTDVNDTIYIQDYGGMVVFYKQITTDTKTIYPNILFIKTDDGLKFDGAINMKAEAYAGWFGIGASYKVWQQNEKVPSYDKGSYFIFDNPADNFCDQVGFSGFISRAIECFGQREDRIKKAHEYVVKEIYPYFLTFYENHVEIIQDKGTESGDFNFFYDYLYRSAKAYDFGTNANGEALNKGTLAVDVSELTVYPLPTELQGKYPIPNTSPTEYFGIYNCKVFLTCNYSLCQPQLDFSKNKYILPGVEEDPIEPKDIEESSLANIEVSLIPGGNYTNSTIRNIAEQSPVKIEFFKDNVLTNTLIFNRDTFTNSTGKVVSGFEKAQYIYKISSSQLLFDSYSGNVTITQSSSIKIKYTYQNGKVLASFSISPVSNDVDYSNVDMNQYPVRLILNKDDKSGSYSFLYDNFSKIDVIQSQIIPLGKYTYTMLSEKLVFGSTSGSIEITPENRSFNFSFGVEYNRSDLDFSVVVSTASSSSNGRIYLSGNSSSVKILSNKLNLTNYYINISIFDINGNLVETLSHTHNGTGGCSDSFTVSKLASGLKYIAQMTYCNGNDVSKDGYIEYQSSTFSFDYKLQTSYTFTYTCTEIS